MNRPTPFELNFEAAVIKHAQEKEALEQARLRQEAEERRKQEVARAAKAEERRVRQANLPERYTDEEQRASLSRVALRVAKAAEESGIPANRTSHKTRWRWYGLQTVATYRCWTISETQTRTGTRIVEPFGFSKDHPDWAHPPTEPIYTPTTYMLADNGDFRVATPPEDESRVIDIWNVDASFLPGLERGLIDFVSEHPEVEAALRK